MCYKESEKENSIKKDNIDNGYNIDGSIDNHQNELIYRKLFFWSKMSEKLQE
jgi:hypothetical protein